METLRKAALWLLAVVLLGGCAAGLLLLFHRVANVLEKPLKALKAAVFLTVMLCAGGVYAQRLPVPIVNHENVVIATSAASAPTAEAVRAAIVNAAKSKKWTVSYAAGGEKIHAKLFVRNKHTVVVEIENTPSSYSVRYVSSIDMKYEVLDGVPVIHPFYNRWVDDLMRAINGELLRI